MGSTPQGYYDEIQERSGNKNRAHLCPYDKCSCRSCVTRPRLHQEHVMPHPTDFPDSVTAFPARVESNTRLQDLLEINRFRETVYRCNELDADGNLTQAAKQAIRALVLLELTIPKVNVTTAFGGPYQPFGRSFIDSCAEHLFSSALNEFVVTLLSMGRLHAMGWSVCGRIASHDRLVETLGLIMSKMDSRVETYRALTIGVPGPDGRWLCGGVFLDSKMIGGDGKPMFEKTTASFSPIFTLLRSRNHRTRFYTWVNLLDNPILFKDLEFRVYKVIRLAAIRNPQEWMPIKGRPQLRYAVSHITDAGTEVKRKEDLEERFCLAPAIAKLVKEILFEWPPTSKLHDVLDFYLDLLERLALHRIPSRFHEGIALALADTIRANKAGDGLGMGPHTTVFVTFAVRILIMCFNNTLKDPTQWDPISYTSGTWCGTANQTREKISMPAPKYWPTSILTGA